MWCIWVCTFPPCISCLPWMSLLWLAVACELLVWFSSLALQGSPSLLLFVGFGVVVVSFLVWSGGLGACGLAFSFLASPVPPPLVVFWCFLVQSVVLVPPSGFLVVLYLQWFGCHTFGMACRGYFLRSPFGSRLYRLKLIKPLYQRVVDLGSGGARSCLLTLWGVLVSLRFEPPCAHPGHTTNRLWVVYTVICSTKVWTCLVLVCLSADWTGSPVQLFNPLSNQGTVIFFRVCLSADWTGALAPLFLWIWVKSTFTCSTKVLLHCACLSVRRLNRGTCTFCFRLHH